MPAARSLRRHRAVAPRSTQPRKPSVDGRTHLELLDQRLNVIRERKRFSEPLLALFRRFITDSPDEALLRINPLQFAAEQGVERGLAIDLFIHASHAGIVDLSWGVVCEHCAGYLTSPGGLRSVARDTSCALCSADVKGSMDDTIEVTFTVAPATRRIRFHDLKEASREDVMRVYFSPSVTLSREFRAWIESSWLAVRSVGPFGEVTLDLHLQQAEHSLITNENHTRALVHVGRRGASRIEIDLLDGRFVPGEVSVKAGAVQIHVRNRAAEATNLVFARLPGDADLNGPDPFYSIGPFLTGKRLLSTHSYRELFRGETLGHGSSLGIRSLCFLFTDLKASTALYDRVGDIKALSMVREHFGVIGQQVATHGGAIVKTIGDAVMATFDEPRAAMEAAIQLEPSLRGHRATRKLSLKVGLHVGPCVVMDSNDRLDYFGQTVNIAARVQALAQGGEVVCTRDVWEAPGASEVVKAGRLKSRRERTRLKGVVGSVGITRISAAR